VRNSLSWIGWVRGVLAVAVLLPVISLEVSCGDDPFDCSKGPGSLSDYCASMPCPSKTVEEAFAGWTCVPSTEQERECHGVPLPERYEGCGLITFSWSGGYGGNVESFDATTGRLVGMRTSSDISATCTGGQVRSTSVPCADEKRFSCHRSPDASPIPSGLPPCAKDGGAEASVRDAALRD